MQFTVTVTAALFAALAAAAPAAVAPRSGERVFVVHDFKANCETHGTRCTYSFNLFAPDKKDDVAPGPHCGVELTQTTAGKLPEVTNGGCDTPDRTWTLTQSGDDLVLAAQIPGTQFVGSHKLSSNDLPINGDGAAVAQNYVGQGDFDLLAN